MKRSSIWPTPKRKYLSKQKVFKLTSRVARSITFTVLNPNCSHLTEVESPHLQIFKMVFGKAQELTLLITHNMKWNLLTSTGIKISGRRFLLNIFSKQLNLSIQPWKAKSMDRCSQTLSNWRECIRMGSQSLTMDIDWICIQSTLVPVKAHFLAALRERILACLGPHLKTSSSRKKNWRSYLRQLVLNQ